MWALADCNTFFASVERVFHPGLRGKPVVVLSNNDGIIVALTGEAKALGLKRGDPLFKERDTVERNRVAVFSTNMMLYAAMSKRVQGIMRQYVQYSESYSIDEVFLNLDNSAIHYSASPSSHASANLANFSKESLVTLWSFSVIPSIGWFLVSYSSIISEKWRSSTILGSFAGVESFT